MDTFILLVVIFGLFAWGLWWLLKYTRDTVGENSPLKASRVYQVSELKYFTGFDGIMASLMVLMGVILFVQLARMPLPVNDSHSIFFYLVFFVAPLSLLGLGALSFTLQLNHWPYVRDVVIKTNPDDHSLEITFGDRSLTVREGDIERIHAVHGKARISYGYWTYYLSDGDHFIMSSRMPGEEVILEYFPKVPFSISYGKFGFIERMILL